MHHNWVLKIQLSSRVLATREKPLISYILYRRRYREKQSSNVFHDVVKVYLESIIHSDPNDIVLDVTNGYHSPPTKSGWYGSRSGPIIRSDVKVFDFRGPISRKAPLQTGAGNPTHLRVGYAGDVNRPGRRGQVHINRSIRPCNTSRSIDEEAIDREAESAPDCAEPADSVLFGNRAARTASKGRRLLLPRTLKIGFNSNNNISGLPVISDLAAADNAVRLCLAGSRYGS